MKVLVVGSGAREHAIVWKLATGSAVDTIYCAPGNGGTALIARNLDIRCETEAQCDRLAGWAFSNGIELVIIGPEVPLRHGLADSLMLLQVPVLGPTQAAARIEWSKSWARDFMARHDIPAPGYTVVQGIDTAIEKLRSPETAYPLVLKADGLAAGKGVAVVGSAEEGADALAHLATSHLLDTEATADGAGTGQGAVVLFEEFLRGYEVSALAFTDGKHCAMMPPACDYKRLLDGDEGPITGGMGAYSPTRRIDGALWTLVERDIIQKAVDALASEGTPFRGVIYAGLMITEQGPKVLEFNCRMGDPETQVLLPRLVTPLEEIGLAIADGNLGRVLPLNWSPDVTVGVVLASEGYPTAKSPGVPVRGLGDLSEGVLVFHGGTELEGAISLTADEGGGASPNKGKSLFRSLISREPKPTEILEGEMQLVANGGRILTVVGRGLDIEAARKAAYGDIERITMPGVQYRRDIAAREINATTP
ncbi:MAG: phosphoribosylamine--glycine ligase [Chloroflexota bacterium]|nr:phosphoribosylamine--glycine ligase [Chloroflexota bacterium]